MSLNESSERWNRWNLSGGPRYPHEKVVQFCFRNYPTMEARRKIRALDWGCGSGVHTVFLAREGFQVWATDLSEQGIENTRQKLATAGLTADLRVQPLAELDLPNGSIDLVISVGVFDAAGPDEVRHGLRRLLPVLAEGAKGLFLFAANDDFRITGENAMGLYGYARDEVEALMQGFSTLWIDSYITTYYGMREIQHDWLVTVVK